MPDGAMSAAVSKPGSVPTGPGMSAWPEYLVDAFQRRVLFLDLLRQRGNDAIEMESRPLATVLRFEHEVIMSGKTLRRPMNYALSKIIAPPGVVTNPNKRPVVVIDPRAGQRARNRRVQGGERDRRCAECRPSGLFHRLQAIPEPGQQFLDVVEGQVTFLRARVVALHPGRAAPVCDRQLPGGLPDSDGRHAAARPVWALSGRGLADVVLAGRHGENPMRYSGGLNRRQLAHRHDQRLGGRQVRRHLAGPELRQRWNPPTGCGASNTRSMPTSIPGASATSSSRNGGAISSS
jgi:hypothetical protein